ncbi:MAG: hypothetical protein LQ345_001043 [Seirophora villosa]|nr:MAG: hypothetical protein LQ345_001043 [Seirophora villosa]
MSGSAVGLQVDLPSLTTLVLNLGAAGLGKFAQAGVDAQTLVCMGEIAGVSPASSEYRKEISLCRQQQRKQSIWLYKLVEIGTASNFVIDELLKKKAGECIIALMSTILPVLPGDACDFVFLKLFEDATVNPDKTPGFAQLRALRAAVSPLARGMTFKDKLCQYQVIINRLRPREPYGFRQGIPDAETLVHLILMFRKLISVGTQFVLKYRGCQGAAWVIAYARHVLSLPVCVMQTAQDSVPISGEYKDAKVLVYTFENESRCELVASAGIEEVIVPRTLTTMKQDQWVVDVKNIDLQGLFMPPAPIAKETASLIVSSLALMFTGQLAHAMGHIKDGFSANGVFQPYAVHCLPHLYGRALRALGIMGFHIPPTTEFNESTWKQFFTCGTVLETADGGCYHLKPNLRWTQVFTHNQIGGTSEPESHLDESERGLVFFMAQIAAAAAWLAFSDWGDNLSLMSVLFIERGFKGLSGSAFFFPYRHNRTAFEFSPHKVTIMEITRNLAHIVGFSLLGEVTDSTPHKNITAFESLNTIVLRAAASQNSVDLEAAIIHFYPGSIAMLGERRPMIEDEVKEDHWKAKPSLNKFGEREWEAELCPQDAFPELETRFESKLSRSSIIATRLIIIGRQIHPIQNPDFMNDKILNMRVTVGCSHPFRTPVRLVVRDIIHSATTSEMGKRCQAFVTRQGAKSCEIYLQAVDRNPCGQWIAVYHQTLLCPGPEHHLLQRGMCTPCTIKGISSIMQNNHAIKAAWEVIPCQMVEGPKD